VLVGWVNRQNDTVCVHSFTGRSLIGGLFMCIMLHDCYYFFSVLE
jgi:hypothetical protein